MNFMNFRLKATILALSLLTVSANSNLFASDHHHHHHHQVVKPAQANYQDEEELNPVIDQPIPFTVRNLKKNVDVHASKSIFEVEIPGLYSIDSFLVLNIPNTDSIIEESVAGYITINESKFLTFFNRETKTLDNPIVNFHFNDRLVYLEKGDKVSVILSEFPPETTVLARGFVMIALNNTH